MRCGIRPVCVCVYEPYAIGPSPAGARTWIGKCSPGYLFTVRAKYAGLERFTLLA